MEDINVDLVELKSKATLLAPTEQTQLLADIKEFQELDRLAQSSQTKDSTYTVSDEDASIKQSIEDYQEELNNIPFEKKQLENEHLNFKLEVQHAKERNRDINKQLREARKECSYTIPFSKEEKQYKEKIEGLKKQKRDAKVQAKSFPLKQESLAMKQSALERKEQKITKTIENLKSGKGKKMSEILAKRDTLNSYLAKSYQSIIQQIPIYTQINSLNELMKKLADSTHQADIIKFIQVGVNGQKTNQEVTEAFFSLVEEIEMYLASNKAISLATPLEPIPEKISRNVALLNKIIIAINLNKTQNKQNRNNDNRNDASFLDDETIIPLPDNNER